jgi:hypothetical protein
MLRKFNCDACGKSSQTYRRDTRFCSDKCKVRYHRKQKRINEVNTNADLSVFVPSVTKVSRKFVTEQNSITKNERPGIAKLSKPVQGTMEGWKACRHHAVCWCDECLKLYLNVEGNEDGGYRRVRYIDGNSSLFAVWCKEPVYYGNKIADRKDVP